jgi:hypothetical protein
MDGDRWLCHAIENLNPDELATCGIPDEFRCYICELDVNRLLQTGQSHIKRLDGLPVSALGGIHEPLVAGGGNQRPDGQKRHHHHGRTPPCDEALIAAGGARVVIAMRDPDPRTAGLGLERIIQAGVAAAIGVLEDEARELNIGFVSRLTRGRPWVRMKIAASLDGKTALANGKSRWITG